MAKRINYDATTDVAYLEPREPAPDEVLGPALLLEPDPAFHALVIADFVVRTGMLVGFEFVSASRCLPGALLSVAERIDGQNLSERLRARFRGHHAIEGEPGHVH
jgi:uncharacterized protein YuzE